MLSLRLRLGQSRNGAGLVTYQTESDAHWGEGVVLKEVGIKRMNEGRMKLIEACNAWFDVSW
jgi:hypothetical protein